LWPVVSRMFLPKKLLKSVHSSYDSFIRPPGTAVPGGLMFYYGRLVFSAFFSTRARRAPSSDRRETLPRDRKWAIFYNRRPKI